MPISEVLFRNTHLTVFSILFHEWICGLKELKFVYMATRLTVRGLHYNTLKLREGNYTTSMATISLVSN